MATAPIRKECFGAYGRAIARSLAITLAAASMAAAPTQGAQAGDAQMQQVAAPVSSCSWTTDKELCDLRNAASAARRYAETREGVGILIHVGKDIPNAKIKTADQLGALFVQRFRALGENARYFIAPNDARATGINYYIGDLIAGQHNGTENRDLQFAWNSAPDVIKQLDVIRTLASVPGAERSPGG